jgi:hypothetical protein
MKTFNWGILDDIEDFWTVIVSWPYISVENVYKFNEIVTFWPALPPSPTPPSTPPYSSWIFIFDACIVAIKQLFSTLLFLSCNCWPLLVYVIDRKKNHESMKLLQVFTTSQISLDSILVERKYWLELEVPSNLSGLSTLSTRNLTYVYL